MRYSWDMPALPGRGHPDSLMSAPARSGIDALKPFFRGLVERLGE